MKGNHISVLISDQRSIQKILGIVSLEGKALTGKIRPFSKIRSTTTTAFCQSIFKYLEAIPILDNRGNLLTEENKMTLVGCILVAAEWNIYENNQQKTRYKQTRIKVKFNLTGSFLKKIYKIVNSRIARSTSSRKLPK
jgi:hypothetical protein